MHTAASIDTKEQEWILREKYNGIQSAAYKRDLQRLARGEPVDYIIGHTPFLGAHIDLSYRPLIPRPETEYWTERAIEDIQNTFPGTAPRCLDLFAGSGCIGIALLQHIQNAAVDFGEKMPRLLKQIRTNLIAHKLEQRQVRVVATNCFDSIDQRYHAILANPPYVAEGSSALTENVRRWEPHIALFAPQGGMYYITRLLQQAPRRLLRGGLLYCEIDPAHAPQVLKTIRSMPAYRHAEIHNDQYGVQRVLRAQVRG